MLNIPNFERLKIFHIVHLNRSIQKAANVLGITRSAVSQSLKGLEQELGLTLFIRDSKKFQPTIPADELFKSIDPFVSELHATLRQIEVGRKMPIGHLRIGAPLDFGSGLLTEIIGKFRKKFPEVTFELHLAVPVKQLEMLCRGELDLAFIDNGDIHANKFPVTIQHSIKEEFILAASEKSYKALGLKSFSYKTLSEAYFVDYLSNAPVTRMWFRHHFSKIPNTLKLSFSAESVRAVLNAIKHDLGIGVVPRRLLIGEFKELVEVKSIKSPFINVMMIARQEGKKPTAKEQEFIKFFKEQR